MGGVLAIVSFHHWCVRRVFRARAARAASGDCVHSRLACVSGPGKHWDRAKESKAGQPAERPLLIGVDFEGLVPRHLKRFAGIAMSASSCDCVLAVASIVDRRVRRAARDLKTVARRARLEC